MRGKQLAGVLLGCIILASLSVFQANGNGCVYNGAGETVYPIDSKDISLVAEQVFMRLCYPEVETDCYFHLRNYGPAQEVQIGFPDNRINWGGIRTITVIDLSTGTKPSLTEKPGEHYGEKVFLWRTRFYRGETKILNVKYRFGFTMPDGGRDRFGYIFHTGALWKGPIKRADFYLDLGGRIPLPCLSLTPHSFLYLGDRVEWHFAEIEPDFDLEVSFIGIREGTQITPEMYNFFQAEPDDDYLWDEQFYEPSDLEPVAAEDESKDNPEWVKWAEEEIQRASYVRNLIYAYHGYIFKTEKWRAEFATKPWYRPDPDFTESMFNAIEKINIRYTLETEKELKAKLL